MPSASDRLVVVCGWPVSGKTTIAKRLQQALGFHRVDIDDVRLLATGLPNPHPDASLELRQRDADEMAAAYKLLLSITDWHLERTRPLIITATFSRVSGQRDLKTVIDRHPHMPVRIIWCRPEGDTRAEIGLRLQREFGRDYVGGVNSYDRYLEVKARYESIGLPHMKLDTGPQRSVDESVEMALGYILLEQHD